jgi:putative PIN family toxin of toxin-antitoxin system
MRAVLDTNIVVSHTLAPRGPISAILSYWLRNAFDLVVSEALLEEYEAALKKPYIQAHHHKSEAAIATLIKRFRKLAIVVTPTETLTVVPDDPDDNKIIECAVAGEADYIVTGDAHLLAIKAYQGIQILTPALFVTILEHEARKKAA